MTMIMMMMIIIVISQSYCMHWPLVS